ncbi:hypothetical protein LshimejAT787_0111010 [Lyophyllum shimeji]|uniref:Uncharacterized protein n=1 Tax=Lyophyllum shimeji TaxID=47721 RepID=A0A9P3PEZ5_LYOSH|nr:hypothetical protein LshimejAT787_0111010 [Lyophyllum shimeji]
MHEETEKSRSATPESTLTNSFHHANSTIDDLTLALANFSRVPSPEPPTVLACCCGTQDCENARAWLELKSRLESRLILSAEVGQALLQRHEAYVRRHEVHKRPQLPGDAEGDRGDDGLLHDTSALQITELIKEKAKLEKRLNQALVNNEVTEVSTKTILHELQEARTTIARLTAQHARSVGWETRLSTAIRERDDMQQERDGESNRAKLAESRLAAMKDKTAKLQSEVRRLQDVLEERRLHRLESSEHILQDARARLEALHSSQLGQTAMVEHAELTNVLESLVNDNETLKRDNAELQNMLADAREEIHTLQEEVEEHRAKPPSRSRAGTPQLRHQIYTSSVPGSLSKDHPMQYFNPRSASLDRKNRRPFEPLTPETSQRPLSPADSLTPSEARFSFLSQPQPRYPSSHVSIEVDESFVDNEDDPASPEKPKIHRTLLLLTRSRAVQTDPWLSVHSPSPLPSYVSSSSPRDPRSESSSFSENLSSHLSVLLERVSGLQTRLSQADALTLTNRLKRQHLKGADVRHLSRSTVNNILTESTNLRSHFRHLLEDDTVVTPCTRKDFRTLFRLFKDFLADMGEMRVLLNDVILDPSCASRVSELALNPSKAEEERKEKERETSSTAAGGWMAPISKLFSPTGRGDNSAERLGLSRSKSSRGSTRPQRFIPKLGPALSASATTVNVEFSGTAIGRSTTSTVASQEKQSGGDAPAPPVPSHSASAVMGIFAGAPQNTMPDPWVVIPKGPRRVQSFMKPSKEFNAATIGGSGNRSNGNVISRDVDAVIDVERPIGGNDEESDDLAPLLSRTLRRRGLSDSSIHSTFTSQAEQPRSPQPSTAEAFAWPDRHSVLQTLSRTVQSLRQSASGTGPPAVVVEPPVALPPHQPSQPLDATRASSPGLRNFLPNLSSWAASASALEPTPDPFLVGTVRDESFIPPRTRRPGESHGHEYF